MCNHPSSNKVILFLRANEVNNDSIIHVFQRVEKATRDIDFQINYIEDISEYPRLPVVVFVSGGLIVRIIESPKITEEYILSCLRSF